MKKVEKLEGGRRAAAKTKQYLMAANWSHCFVGSKESTVRWVLELGVGVVAGQVLTDGRWVNMHRSEVKDVQEEVDDNDIVANYATAYAGEIVLISELPEWARDQTDVPVSVEGALLLMCEGHRVHTYTIAFGFQGCSIDRCDLEARIVKSGNAWVSQKCGMKHELMILDQGRELYIECDPGRLADRRDAMRMRAQWPAKRVTRTVSQEQALLASTTLKQFWSHQRARNQLGTVLTLRLSDSAETLVGWTVARSSAALLASHPFTRETAGWVVQRERAFDDASRQRRQLKVSPESQETEKAAA